MAKCPKCKIGNLDLIEVWDEDTNTGLFRCTHCLKDLLGEITEEYMQVEGEQHEEN